jgi:type 1 glutamine amidotransferase
MRNALIFWGGWAGHQPEECSAVVRELLESNGFNVRVEDNTTCLRNLNAQDVDLIVPIVTMSKIEKEDEQALTSAVKSGVGLAGFHGGLGDSFRECSQYQYMVGGQFVAHPGDFIDYTVNITRPDDEIVKGISDFEFHSEQYYMHVDPSNEVLAETTVSGAHDAWTKGAVMPVVWKRRYGEGRVFYSALGHSADELKIPQVRDIFVRGAAWAARG